MTRWTDEQWRYFRRGLLIGSAHALLCGIALVIVVCVSICLAHWIGGAA